MIFSSLFSCVKCLRDRFRKLYKLIFCLFDYLCDFKRDEINANSSFSDARSTIECARGWIFQRTLIRPIQPKNVWGTFDIVSLAAKNNPYGLQLVMDILLPFSEKVLQTLGGVSYGTNSKRAGKCHFLRTHFQKKSFVRLTPPNKSALESVETDASSFEIQALEATKWPKSARSHIFV